MFFCAESFKTNAPNNIKRLVPNTHLEVLDGKEVTFRGDYGEVHYDIIGSECEWVLYPIDKSWCKNERQETLLI